MTTKIVLGIETSCDDTSIALIKGYSDDINSPPTLLAHNSFSQEQLLDKWGGVVPEIAARNHLAKLVPLLEKTFSDAGVTPSEVNLIGVTTHPGLLGPLLTGLNGAKSLALFHKTPIRPVNHLYAHLEAIHLTKTVGYPYIGLLVSGGHSLYMLVHGPDSFEILGTTLDDAAGEAFDKGGKILGLGYPAGRIIDDLSQEGDPKRFKFPIGLENSANANLSYSGVKTALRQFIEQNPQYSCEGLSKESYPEEIHDICASYQHAIVSALKLKLKYAIRLADEKVGSKTLPIIVGGGVACNSYLRKVLTESYRDVFFVNPKFCTDNGAMIANLAFRTNDQAISYPECLTLDARGRFITKKEKLDIAKKSKLEQKKQGKRP
ncbi:tRNA (adenosine(37)-N6)-threonylcarbamoyltransferase complex transferase subunit TsaD [Halobacteriovorax sp. GB3]|uniref:tRNA (adenosine(37)-N6)-threonylcarbamoyltransferase complex transferase subunit TsaD n=1 Tax=Halobacteriovorax sp. GB3 TaxID=2719615 RepID=UPI002361DBC8|nr:tRNA (adenosine(37)-N6)-threonylcarbamoyltransferase complex transferase subunit TsaD [Halobacteriovorax sp. GB3]MDD0851581.1 tRNA (adenosine(37)-N6)-threonylcarbamoyltransferase complex transferase subunit TsaD [Halobacteriovorax sp. GB3]